MRYSNAKCDLLSSVVLFLGLVPSTLFSILFLFKMRIKKDHCMRECVHLPMSLSLALLHTLCIYVSLCVCIICRLSIALAVPQ